MMTGIPIENNLWTAYLLTIFFVVAGFAVYDVLYRRVPDRALVFFIPLASLAPVLQGYFLLNHGLPPLFLWPVATHALVGALLGFCIPLAAALATNGTGLGGGHDEREQTLNQLLVEMDGFAANEGVVVLAATNRADVLDPALLRPGRFDRQVYVGLPDIKGREEILKVHAKGKPLAEDVSLRKLAQGTAGFTGADLENLINEGALLAARKDQHFITMQDLKDAEIKVIAGPEKKSRVIPQHERELTAYHEAGHAVVMHMLPGQDPVSQITIVPRGMAGGMTISLPEEDRSYLSKHYMEDQIVGLLGGRVAEKLCLNDISTGASNDIQRATAIARKMVTVYGMSERLGTVSFDSGNDEVFIGRTMGHSRGYSEAVAAQIDQEVKDLVDGAYRRCQDILEAQRDKLEQVAQYLLEHETMERDAFLTVFGEKTHEQPENVPAADAEDQD